MVDLRFSVLSPALLKALGKEAVQLALSAVGVVILLLISAYVSVSEKKKIT